TPGEPRATSAGRLTRRRALFLEGRFHQWLQLTLLVQLGDDVAAADELALDEDLGDRRPVGVGREGLPDPGVGKDVHRLEAPPQPLEDGDGAGRETAHRHIRSAFREEDDGTRVDVLLDLVQERVWHQRVSCDPLSRSHSAGVAVLSASAWIAWSAISCWNSA